MSDADRPTIPPGRSMRGSEFDAVAGPGGSARRGGPRRPAPSASRPRVRRPEVCARSRGTRAGPGGRRIPARCRDGFVGLRRGGRGVAAGRPAVGQLRSGRADSVRRRAGLSWSSRSTVPSNTRVSSGCRRARASATWWRLPAATGRGWTRIALGVNSTWPRRCTTATRSVSRRVTMWPRLCHGEPAAGASAAAGRRTDRPQPGDRRRTRCAAGDRSGHRSQDHRLARRAAVRRGRGPADSQARRREDVREAQGPRDGALRWAAAAGLRSGRSLPPSRPGRSRRATSARGRCARRWPRCCSLGEARPASGARSLLPVVLGAGLIAARLASCPPGRRHWTSRPMGAGLGCSSSRRPARRATATRRRRSGRRPGRRPPSRSRRPSRAIRS